MTSTSLTSPLDDSSATPITPDTTDATTKLSSRRLLKGTSATVKMIGSAIGIPGVSEVRQMAGKLVLVRPSALFGKAAHPMLSKRQTSIMRRSQT
ncbi:hypothetical protein FRC12_015015 [Ceratobasidium sp. 428]|nr:hypothetical protein FRC12_015015 [Ceratobasidium sp. 428]